MKDESLSEDQQHDAISPLGYRFDLDRRAFFKVLGSGVIVGLSIKSGLSQESGKISNPHSEEELPNSIAAWIHIAADGRVTVYTGKVEMGQNIRTSLSQQVAEELRVPLSSVQLVMGDTHLTPFDRGTFGSRTTPTMGSWLRSIASSARSLLIDMAAERWHADGASLVAKDGLITEPKTNRSISYGELTRGQQMVKVVDDRQAITPAKDWRIAGTAVPKIDGRAFVTGKHKYTSDMKLPGMLYGKMVRASAFQATLVSVDSAEIEKMPGVQVVRDSNFVGVVSADEYAAANALKRLRVQWKTVTQPSENELFNYLRNNPEGGDDRDEHLVGSVDKGRASAAKKLAQTYTVAYIAHVPLEPRAALAEWNGDQLTVWTGTQRPFGVRDDLAQTFRIPKESVRVVVPDTGSAYGGKHIGDAAIEAARLAKTAAKPVKVVWTREEEFTWAYFRPAGVIDVKGGVDEQGNVVVWEFDNYNSGPAAIGTPYNIANQRIEFHPANSPLRQGSYRGLAATANHFARETHMDELAHLVGIDPLEFRLKNLTEPRLRAVLQTAANRIGWKESKSSPTRALGIAGGMEKGGYVATCAEVSVDRTNGTVKIVRIAEAFECGAIVNPQGLKNQIEGAIVQAIGGALFESIHFKNGRILNPHLAGYRVPRFTDTPVIEIDMLDRKDLPSAGAGETPIVGLAPAVGNAIFAATGIRLRSLPLAPDGSVSSTSSAASVGGACTPIRKS